MNRRVFATNAAVWLAALGGAPALLAQKLRGKVKGKGDGGKFTIADPPVPAPPAAQSGLLVPAGTNYEIRGTLEVNANVIVEGRLVMRPGATLRFVNVDESKFVGGGMNPVDTDVGLWVVGAGVLDIQGTSKAAWNNTGWDPTWYQDGNVDELVLTPTAPGDTTGFSPFPLGGVVPRVNGRWDAEVLNLSRDVVIEGTPGGRSHIHIRSTRPQTVRHCLIRHMGPRQRSGQYTEGVLGRYGLHFHHNHQGSRGTILEGVVVRDCGNHSFVPHESHGITLRDCIAYDVFEDAYWWDLRDSSNDIVIDHCVAALVKSDPEFRGHRTNGFTLGGGPGNVVRDSVAVGIQGSKDASGFHWPEIGKASGSWVFSDNVAHNNERHGIFTWQNNSAPHVIDRFVAYRCGGFGVSQGAYVTPYFHYSDLDLFENEEGGIMLHSLHGLDAPDRQDGYGMSFENVLITGGVNGIVHVRHALVTNLPTLLKNIRFERQIGRKIRIHEAGNGGTVPGLHDYVDCGLVPTDLQLVSTVPGFRLRVQDRSDGSAWSMDHNGNLTSVPVFYNG